MLVGFTLALVSALLLTGFVRHHARRNGLFDHPDERKVHRDPVPRIGGVAIVLSCACTLAFLLAMRGRAAVGLDAPLLALLGGALAMHLWGIYDDLHPLRARFKLAGQLLIATCTYALGLRVPGITLPLLDALMFGPVLSATFTVLWLIAITNAFNLIDGMDGLAGGVAVFALGAFCILGLGFERSGAALVALVVAGATLGFLRYNFHPASIFLGDSGSLFLGFMLAGLSLTTAQSPAGPVAIAIPLVILGIPVLDTGVTIVRRYLSGHGIFEPDRGHVHHRLLDRGLSPRSVALILYAMSAGLALVGLILATHAKLAAGIVGVCAIGAMVVMRSLRFHEFEELTQVLFRGVQQRRAIGRSVRFREAATRLSALDDLHEIFRTLQQVFEVNGAPQVQVRLRRDFVRDLLDEASDGRGDDELTVWSWSRNGGPSSTCWEIALPLSSPDCERIGSLVVWEEGEDGESLSHLRAVRLHLSSALQRKLFALGGHASLLPSVTGVPERASRRRPLHRPQELVAPAARAIREKREPALTEEG